MASTFSSKQKADILRKILRRTEQYYETALRSDELREADATLSRATNRRG